MMGKYHVRVVIKHSTKQRYNDARLLTNIFPRTSKYIANVALMVVIGPDKLISIM